MDASTVSVVDTATSLVTRTTRFSIGSVAHTDPPPDKTNDACTPMCSLIGASALEALPHATATMSAATATGRESRLTTTLCHITTRLR